MMTPRQMLLVALLLALPFVPASAQRGYSRAQYNMLDEARTLMEAGQWSDAYKIYKRLLNADTTSAETYYGIGMCEANMPDKRAMASSHFEIAVRHGHQEALYRLALERHRQERFGEELALLEQYRSRNGRDIPREEIDRQIAMAHTASSLTADPVRLKIRNLGPAVNSPAHDYCPVVTADGSRMFFTSRRAGTMGALKDASDQFYEDIYVSEQQGGQWGAARNVGAPINSIMQDATVGLSPDGNEMIIYRAGTDNPAGELLISQRAQGIWSTPARMTDKINSKYHEPSAAISPDGSEIYFTSDRPGGFGGRDLYRIRRLPNGQWSEPLNLGPEINTPYDEDAPFLHSDGTTLFFSSNGHNTMGGFDIFKAALLDPDMNVWEKPVNLGYPLNTVNDDIYFSLSEDGRTGYFSSERPGGLGGQDIHEVIFPVSQVEYQLVQGVVTDGNEQPLKARIVVTDTRTETVFGIYNTNGRTGRYIMAIRPGQPYQLDVSAEGYVDRELNLLTTDEDVVDLMMLDIKLAPGEKTAGALAKP
ncbi:MAG TPA: hypothetical protein PKD45_03775 [Flavobacteriales bacterium]|nr:hypothetical protein [Flavobacteriales bacterium]